MWFFRKKDTRKYKRKFGKIEENFCSDCGRKLYLSFGFDNSAFDSITGKILTLNIKIKKECFLYHVSTFTSYHDRFVIESKVPKKYWKTMARLFSLDESKM